MKILRVNMTRLEVVYENLHDDYLLLGNRGLIAEIANREIPATCEPLGKYNKLIIAIGPLVGLGITSAARVSVGGKSPLTGGIKEANGGGIAGQKMAKHGIRTIIVEGLPQDEGGYILVISKKGVSLQKAPEYSMWGNYALAERLLEQYGNKSGLICIGPAGEMKMSAAGVFINDADGSPSRACARGGMGAVMGSKGLKAIVIADDGDYKPEATDSEDFKKARQAFHDVILSNPLTSEIYTKYGTAGAVMTVNQLGNFPTFNFRAGSFDHAGEISGEALYDLIGERKGQGRQSHACMNGCLIRCSNVVPKKDGTPLVSPLEYESISLLGSNLGIKSLDDISTLNYLCNDYGVDTIEVGAAMGIAVEAGLGKFGDTPGFIRLLEEIKAGTPLGRIIGQGAVITGKVYGVARVPACKGQSFAAHEPRALKGMAVTYAMSPMGADHTAGLTLRAPIDSKNPVGQMEVSRNAQVLAAAYDALGFCVFVVPAVGKKPELLIDIINAVFQTDLDPVWIIGLGKRVLQREREFNLAAGLNSAHDRLPEFCLEEPLPPHNHVADIPPEDYRRFWEEEFWGK